MASSLRKILRVSEIASGAICEAKMHYAEMVALCIIKSVCGLLKVLVVCLLTFSGSDCACIYKRLGHYFLNFSSTDSTCTKASICFIVKCLL